MKRYAVLFSFLLLSLALITPPTAVSLTVSFHKRWALIAIPHYDFELSLDAMELEQTLESESFYNFDDVRYMTSMDKQDLREAITTWESDSDDLVFIYIESHGGGYNVREGELYGPEDAIDGSRGDPKDEGDEFRETDVNLDFDGDEVLESNVWGGIDECIAVKPYDWSIPEYYWDDEVKEDLDYLAQNGKYGRLVFFWNGPKLPNSTEGCFSGGFVRDLSAPNRIIVTSSNETDFGYGHGDPEALGYTFTYFGRPFVRALDPDNTAFYQADLNGDGAVSMYEAFQYAWENDEARIDGRETPQLDDNGDGVANSGDGLLAYQTLLVSERPLSTDVNWDGKVNILDIGLVIREWQNNASNPYIDFDGNMFITITDVARVVLDYGRTYVDTAEAEWTGTPELFLYPDEILGYKGETFSVDVKITNVTDLYCYQFQLYYKTSVLNCTSVSLPTNHFLKPVNPSYILVVKQEYDNAYNATHGRVWVAITLRADEPGKNGGGTLATINFKIKECGNSNLHFYDVEIGDSLAEALPIIVFDGSVNVPTSLMVLTEDQYGSSLTTGDVYIDGQWCGLTGSTFLVPAGTHTVWVNDFWESGGTGNRCCFTNWEDSSTDNPRTIQVVEDTTITAHFYKKYCPGDVDGNGVVNFADLDIASEAWGSVRGDPNWDSRADSDCDGLINGFDLATVVFHISTCNPTGHIVGGGSWWHNPQNAYDDDQNSYTDVECRFFKWTSFLTLTLDETITSDAINILLGQGRYGGIWKVDIDVYKDDEWINVYEGSPVFDEWWLHRFDSGAVSQMRIRAFGLNYLHHPYLRVYEAIFFKNTVYP